MAELDDVFAGLEGFEWDAGNSDKNWLRHGVRQTEAEQALLNTPVVVEATTKHGSSEPRFVALGRTDTGRFLTLVFTVRARRIRVISARAMSKAERRIYGQVEAEVQADSDIQK
jgi:hypothetical protein